MLATDPRPLEEKQQEVLAEIEVGGKHRAWRVQGVLRVDRRGWTVVGAGHVERGSRWVERGGGGTWRVQSMKEWSAVVGWSSVEAGRGGCRAWWGVEQVG